MFKNMKLGTKISAGFAALILISLSLGGLAVWSMSGVKTIANTLANANVPEVAVANEVERDSLSTMYETRGYAFSEDKAFLEKARINLAQVKKDLQDAEDHAARFGLTVLKQNADQAAAKATEYERLLNETVARTDAMAKDKAAMDEAAAKYMELCDAFLKDQLGQLDTEIDTAMSASDAKTTTQPAAASSKLKERVTKTVLCNDVIDLGNAIRIGNWRAQSSRDPKLFQETQKKFVEVNKTLDDLKSITRQEKNLKQIEECRAAGKAYSDAMSSFLANWFAREELNKQRNDVAQAVLDAAKATSTAGMEDTSRASNQAAGSLSTASITMIAGLIAATVLGVCMAFFITRSITKPINRIIAGLTDGASQVNDAAGQVSSASQQLAGGASEQASSLEETSSALEEMAAMTRTNASNAKEANGLAGQARSAAEGGDRTMVQLNEAMTAINTSSEKISKIIKVIEEIAFQTNLLALNAAVEAARAGDHGKGFAVVADEVRNLAQRAAQAARETTELIENAVNSARQGTQISGEVGKALSAIVGDAAKVADLINNISKASDEQAQGVDQVNTAVAQMDKVTQQNASAAEESAAAAEELSAQAEAVKSMVDELTAMVQGANQRAAATQATAARKQRATAAHAPQRKPVTAAHSEPALVAGAKAAGKQDADEFWSGKDDANTKEF